MVCWAHFVGKPTNVLGSQLSCRGSCRGKQETLHPGAEKVHPPKCSFGESLKGVSVGPKFPEVSIIYPIGSLVGGFNPFEKYSSKWESSPNRGENRK